jgi:putative copper export protein/mono/diheme cytochrome c family protein
VDALIRAGLYVGLVALAGAGAFARWVGPELVEGVVARRLRAGALVGAVLLIGGSVVEAAGALARAVGTFDPSLLTIYLTETRHGHAVLVRTGVVLLLAFLSLRGRVHSGLSPEAPPRWIDHGAFIILVLVLLATFSVTSHAAASGAVLPLAMDTVHLLAMAAWAGGVVYLAWLPLAVRGAGADTLGRAVRRVSSIGLASVIALAITGAYASVLHLYGPPALAATAYGRTLLWKLGTVAVVLSIASVNRWVFVPVIGRRGPPPAFRSVIRAESALLLAVLCITGLLTNRPPAEAPATLGDVISIRETAGRWTVRGSVSPAGRDGMSLEISVFDHVGAPPPEPPGVSVTLTMQDHPMPPVKVTPARIGRGAYRAVIPLPMAGRWQIAIRTPDGNVVRVPIQARGGGVAAGGGWIAALAPLGVLAIAAGMWIAGLRWIGRRRRVAWPLLAGAAACAAVSLILGARVLIPPPSVASLLERPNPIPPTRESIAIGERIYQQHCVACHGITGAGDGPAAAALRPRPADLRVHMAAGHTDGQLFYWITEGFKGTAMPAFKESLREEERWHVLNYIKTFALTDR